MKALDHLKAIGANRDIVLAIGVIAIIAMLILPMPGWMLDLGLALSITLSVMILMTALFIEKPLQLSAFPTILLISTMLRLGLNLASTRLILGHGHEGAEAAGGVIAAFGEFLIGGETVIGLTIFAILIVINFVVITKGAGRIAEVAARFSLDSMPGKQMAIDADLNAGTIDEPTARARRAEVEAESGFYGAMDGASKFVKGDAVAALLITAINVLVGLVMGVAVNFRACSMRPSFNCVSVRSKSVRIGSALESSRNASSLRFCRPSAAARCVRSCSVSMRPVKSSAWRAAEGSVSLTLARMSSEALYAAISSATASRAISLWPS